MKKSDNPTPFTSLKAKVALVHTTNDLVIRALSTPQITALGSENFVSGDLIAPNGTQFDNGKRVHLNLRHVISITEFDSAADFAGGGKKSNLKLFNSKNSV